MRNQRGAYETFIRPLLFSLDAEQAHHCTIALLRQASQFDPALRVLRFLQQPSKPKTLFGVTFPNPIGFGKVTPKSVFGFEGCCKNRSTRSAGSNCEACLSSAIVQWCACSASSENNSGRMNVSYAPR